MSGLKEEKLIKKQTYITYIKLKHADSILEFFNISAKYRQNRAL